MFTRRRQKVAVPEVGADAPEFNLPSAQGGQLRLSMRTARGPVVVVFFRGAWSEEDVEYFKALAAKEDEINLAAASVVGIGLVEPDEAREFVRASGIKSMVLYDYVRVTTQQWGLMEKDKDHSYYARPAVFIVGTDHKVAHAWTDGRPDVDEIMAKITEITGLPKPPEEVEEKPKRPKKTRTSEAAPGQAAPADDKPKKMSKEERDRIKAERRAARESGKSVKSAQPEQSESSEGASGGEQAPKKMSKEERERIKAERRAAREAGKSLKKKPEEEKAQSAGDEAAAEGEEGPRDKAREE